MAESTFPNLLGLAGSAVVGKVAELRFEFRFIPHPPAQISGGLTKALSSPAFCQAAEQRMQVHVRKEFGREFVVQDFDVDLTQQVATAAISTPFAEGISLRGISRKTGRVSNAIRSDLSELIAGEIGAMPSVQASWTQGEGLFDPSRMLSQDTPAPQLEAYLASLKGRRGRLARIRNLMLSIGLLFALLGVPSGLFLAGPVGAFYAAAYVAMAFALFITANAQISDLDLEARDIANELDLRRVETQDIESRAQKLFQSHSFELKRYYDQALQQGRTIYFVGFACLILGFAVIGAALWLVVDYTGPNTSEQIVVGTLGVIGGVLANYVAVVYLRMFSETVKATTGFHQRLVKTHHLHFGNFLAAKIEDDELREDVLAAIAEGLASGAEKSSVQSG